MIITSDKTEWNKILREKFLRKDIYFKYQYFELYEKHYDVDPEAIFWEDANIKVFWTHLARDISKIDQFKNLNYCDLTTPYGYGGPLIEFTNQDNMKLSLSNFFAEYNNYVKNANYVSEFVRFHPFFINNMLLQHIENVEYLNDIVYIDLSDKIDNIWKNLSKGHRYCIRKSIENGCKIRFIKDPSKSDIINFNELYKKAMGRNKASSKYYFSEEFIGSHFELLDTIIVEALFKDELIGASMFLLGDEIVHYHLSGSKKGLGKLYPSHLILFEMVKWAKKMNFKNLMLGGGRGSNDSLFKFKKGFSKSKIPFYVGKLIYDSQIYEKLSKKNLNDPKSNKYFPIYRFGFDKDIL